MTRTQQNKLAMFITVKAVLDGNEAVWQPLTAFADGYGTFTTQIATIQTLGQTQNVKTGGIAEDKHACKTAMAEQALGVARAVRAYAVKIKNHTLASEVDFNLTDITAARDADALQNCQNIHDLANANYGNLAAYGVTPEKLKIFQAAVNAFGDIVSKPRQNIASGKTVTIQLAEAFKVADEALEEQLDNLIGQFAGTNAKFVNDYQNARTIVDISASHSSSTPPAPVPAIVSSTATQAGS